MLQNPYSFINKNNKSKKGPGISLHLRIQDLGILRKWHHQQTAWVGCVSPQSQRKHFQIFMPLFSVWPPTTLLWKDTTQKSNKCWKLSCQLAYHSKVMEFYLSSAHLF